MTATPHHVIAGYGILIGAAVFFAGWISYQVHKINKKL